MSETLPGERRVVFRVRVVAQRSIEEDVERGRRQWQRRVDDGALEHTADGRRQRRVALRQPEQPGAARGKRQIQPLVVQRLHGVPSGAVHSEARSTWQRAQGSVPISSPGSARALTTSRSMVLRGTPRNAATSLALVPAKCSISSNS